MRLFRISAALSLALIAMAVRSSVVWADGGAITTTTVRDLIAQLQKAATITVAAYQLSPNSDMAKALIAAADRSASVDVVVGGGAFGAAKDDNIATLTALTYHGCVLDDGTKNVTQYKCRLHITPKPQHIKVAIIDGEVYVSDRNFATHTTSELVVHDQLPGDRFLLERAVLGDPGANDHLWTRKSDALAAEARLLFGRRSREVRMETESFGSGTPVYHGLLVRARAGDRVRLIVSRIEYGNSSVERRAIADLMRERVDVRLGRSGEKMTIDGDDVWMGSTNATAGVPDQIDWGMMFRDPFLAGHLISQFDRNWDDATPV
jgi:hypothetical protein